MYEEYVMKKGDLMGKIIAFVNQKGGVGKTTSSINLAASLGLLGKKTLLVDLDPQGNTSTGVGIDKSETNASIYELLVDKTELNDVVVKTKFKNLYVIPASINLAGIDMELMELSRENSKFVAQLQLKKYLDQIKDVFDFIILDCPPSLGLITTNALAAANSVIIPVQCEFFALEGIMQLLNSVMIAQKKLNPNLDIEGVLLTMLDNRTNLGLEVVEDVFYVEPEAILTIWAMETNYGSFIGSYDAFNALYSACMNAYCGRSCALWRLLGVHSGLYALSTL